MSGVRGPRPKHARRRATGTVAWCLLLSASCTPAEPVPPPPPPPPAPTGTWRLVEFESSSDEIGTLRPEDPDAYAMELMADGTVAMRLNCNRAYGSWTAAPASGDSGRFEFGPLVVTRSACTPPSMDERIARDADSVRSFLLRNGRLYLSLWADGGVYVWEPVP